MELRNIAIYFYQSIILFFKARWHESYVNFMGACIRIFESFFDFFVRAKVKCNYCGWQGYKFRTFVGITNIRKNAVCPRCLSLERHREFLIIFNQVEKLIDKPGIKLLDIAPTKAFSDYCKKRNDIEYLSVDLSSQFAMYHMNLENLTFKNNSFDMIICYHVLDYLKDDSKGMSEIYRVLNPRGITITQEGVDLLLNKTIEWERPLKENSFRKRQYGLDFFKKWEKAGFRVSAIKSKDNNNITLISTKGEVSLNDCLEDLKTKDYNIFNINK